MPDIYLKHLTVDERAIDVHQHVNNQEYLRWMQEIAIEHSAAQGWPMARYLAGGSSWYVKSHFIDYLRPGVLGDEIIACTWVSGLTERSSPRRTLFLRVRDRQILARAETQWIFVSLDSGRPLLIPDALRSAFAIIESEDEVMKQLAFLLPES